MELAGARGSPVGVVVEVTSALEVIAHFTDTLRWWSVPAAFLGTILLVPIVWKLGRLLLAGWLAQIERHTLAEQVKVSGTQADTIMHPAPRFWAMFAAIFFMLAIMVAGLIIPFSRSGILDDFLLAALEAIGFHSAGLRVAWNALLALSWTLWAFGSWMIVLAFSPRPKFMAVAAITTLAATAVAAHGIGGPTL